MSSEPSARQRFVEAMRDIRNACIGAQVPLALEVRQAVEAFADAECDARKERAECYPDDGEDAGFHHANCRAALLKEIGL